MPIFNRHNGTWAHPKCAVSGCPNTNIVGIQLMINEDAYRTSNFTRLSPPEKLGTKTIVTFTPCQEHEIAFRNHYLDLGFERDDLTVLKPEDIERWRKEEIKFEERRLANELTRRKEAQTPKRVESLPSPTIEQLEDHLGIKIIPKGGNRERR